MTLLPAIISSIFEVCATQPFDVIKTHYQTNTKVIFNLKNLYSGFIPRAIGNIPSRTIFLFSQDFFKNYYSNLSTIKKNIMVPISAGFCQTLVDTPFEILKINKIMNIKYKDNNNLYKGFIPHLSRNIIFLISVYNFREYSKNKTENIIIHSLYGGIGGVIGAYLSHPLDTIKTKIQSSTCKINNKMTIKEYFKGCHIRAGMSMINMVVSLTVFEMFKILNLF
jgi:hypothetical protein